jgi:hypothetical protein
LRWQDPDFDSAITLAACGRFITGYRVVLAVTNYLQTLWINAGILLKIINRG